MCSKGDGGSLCVPRELGAPHVFQRELGAPYVFQESWGLLIRSSKRLELLRVCPRETGISMSTAPKGFSSYTSVIEQRVLDG